jgi:hypothetical protein
MLQADKDAPAAKASIQVALVDAGLPVFLTADGEIEVLVPDKGKQSENQGGTPDIEINWVNRDHWPNFAPVWDEKVAGDCNITRDPADVESITRVEWTINEAFAPYESIVNTKKLGAEALKIFQESYELPVCWGIFTQTVAEQERERRADENGEPVEVPDDYVTGERARLARAVLMAKEPDLVAAIQEED